MPEPLNHSLRCRAAIRIALLNEWDPIGVGHIPEARDEYDSYVDDLYTFICSHRSQQDVFEWLWALETRHMGLDGHSAATARFANRLLSIVQDAERERP